MANTKEIQTRMRSIQDTMKITNAMYMISSSKLKKAKKSLEASTAHFYAIQGSIARILRHVPDIENIYFGTETAPDQKRVGYIVVTADKGLAGAYNQNVIKLVQKELDANPQGELFVVGQIGRNYFEKKGYKIHRHFSIRLRIHPSTEPESLLRRFLSDTMKVSWMRYISYIPEV